MVIAYRFGAICRHGNIYGEVGMSHKVIEKFKWDKVSKGSGIYWELTKNFIFRRHLSDRNNWIFLAFAMLSSACPSEHRVWGILVVFTCRCRGQSGRRFRDQASPCVGGCESLVWGGSGFQIQPCKGYSHLTPGDSFIRGKAGSSWQGWGAGEPFTLAEYAQRSTRVPTLLQRQNSREGALQLHWQSLWLPSFNSREVIMKDRGLASCPFWGCCRDELSIYSCQARRLAAPDT